MINAQEFFTHVLHDSQAVTELLANDGGEPNIFEYPCEEELGDNPGKPYIVVQNTGTTKAGGCKDYGYDEDADITTVEVVCVTDSKEDAKAVAKITRNAIRVAMNEFSESDADLLGFRLNDSSYSDKGVMFDAETGNYFAQLTYRIEIA